MMIDEHRWFRECILCGDGDITKEHLFGKSLARKLKVAGHWIAHATTGDNEHGKEVTGSSPITHIAPKVFCKTCNGKRLGALMESCTPILMRLINAEKCTINSTEIKLLVKYFERFAMIVDVMTSNHEMNKKYLESKDYKRSIIHRQDPPVLTKEERHFWIRNKKVAGIEVYFGHHQGVLGINPDFRIAPRYLYEAGVRRVEKRVCVVVGELAICVDIKRYADPPSADFMKIIEDGGSISWPPKDKVSYGSYLALLNQDVGTQMERVAITLPNAVEQIESFSRQHGRYKIPPELVAITKRMFFIF